MSTSAVDLENAVAATRALLELIGEELQRELEAEGPAGAATAFGIQQLRVCVIEKLEATVAAREREWNEMIK